MNNPPSTPWATVLLLSGDPLADLSPNVDPDGSLKNPHGSRMKKVRLRKKWEGLAQAAWEADGRPVYRVPVEISFHVRRKRRLDPDNALAALKHVIDGLTTRGMTRGKTTEKSGVEGLLPDDGESWVSYLPVEQLTGNLWGEMPHVFIRIRPR